VSAVVTIEPVRGRVARRRFVELPWVLHRDDARWAPPLARFEHWRLDRHRNPFFTAGGDAELLLARRAGQVAGRISAHVRHAGDAEGWFGFLEAVDDADVVAALVDAAVSWLVERGCGSITGPASFTTDVEAGVLTVGHDVVGTTGRPWHPQWYADHLRAVLPGIAAERSMWRHDTAAIAGEPSGVEPVGTVPSITGPYGDPRLVLRGAAGTVAAVPDLAPVLRGGGARSTMELARRAKRHDWERCTVVACQGAPEVLVPALAAAASVAGYGTVVAPWTPDASTPPETVHTLFTRELFARDSAGAGDVGGGVTVGEPDDAVGSDP
jgi:hypothetical protein